MKTYYNKKVLITGGHGMIGRSLVGLLRENGAKIYVADLYKSDDLPDDITQIEIDLREFSNCLKICDGMEYVFHLAGVKGSPKMSKERPADFMIPMLQYNTNMIEAAFKSDVEWFLYTSSVGVYAPSNLFKEDTVWKTFPSINDTYPGWAKRIGELQTETYKIQYDWDRFSIVRPANVYGPYDNFNPENGMVIPSLISKANDYDLLNVMGDGSAIRDFIYTDDVAIGMLSVVEKKIKQPINLGSGNGTSIKEIVNLITKYSQRKNIVSWEKLDNIKGDDIRIFDTSRAKLYGIEPKVSLEDGIRITTDWYNKNKKLLNKRYNPFVNN